MNAVYQGLKEVGCRVVWSLDKGDMGLFDEDVSKNKKFLIRAQIP